MRTDSSIRSARWRYRSSNAGRPTGGAPLLRLLHLPRGPVDVGLWLGDWDCHHCGRSFWGSESVVWDLKGRPKPIGIRSVDCLTEAEEESYWDGVAGGVDPDAGINVCPYCRAIGDEHDGTVGPRDEDEMGAVRWGLVGRLLVVRPA